MDCPGLTVNGVFVAGNRGNGAVVTGFIPCADSTSR